MLTPKQTFRLIRELYASIDWLEKCNDEAVESLLFEDAQNNTQKLNLIVDVLKKLKFVSSIDSRLHLAEFCQKICDEELSDPEVVLIVAMAGGSAPDGSQALVQNLKYEFGKKGVYDVKFINQFAKTYQKAKESNFNIKKIVLVDDFVGSGKTAKGRIDEIVRAFESAQKDCPEIKVRSIYSSSVGVNFLKTENIDFQCLFELPRCISDLHSTDESERMIKEMLEMESTFSEEVSEHKLSECSLGYGGTQTSFAIEDSNIPNNVFPLLWWPKYKDGKNRKTIFYRFMG